MSFSSDIKKELCDVRELSPQQAEAMLYGIMYASRMDEGRPLIQTENIDLMNAAAELIRAVFPNVRTGIVRLVKNSGSLYTLKIRSGWEDIAERFGDFSSISREAVSGGDEESGAFLRGVFVSCGSVTDPNKEYHLELVLPENDRTPALLDFIAEHGMSLKETARGGARSKKTVLYAKESELIEDCLTYIGAANHSIEIMQVKIVKDFRNRVNRSVNCENANLDKTVAASNKSTADIEYIFSTMGADWLSPDLRETARLRVENPEMSLSELCGIFPEKISRSGLNHRLKKLSKLAEELRSSRPE
jgi:DNA-binding protein WhiA